MIKLHSRKGVSGAISAMFVIAIFFIILVSTFVITAMTNRYNQVVTERNRMDWERDSESIFFIAAEVKSGVLNLSFSNDGAVTLHIVQVWLSQFPDGSYGESNNQSQYRTNMYASSGQTVNNFGTAANFSRIYIPPVPIGGLIKLSNIASTYCKIKLVTERGNSFECQIPWPITTDGNGGGAVGGYVLQIDSEYGNFEYAFGTMPGYKAAFVKGPTVVPTLYRILIRNTSEKDIVVLSNSTMLQIYGGVGNVALWYIVAPPVDESGLSYLPLDPTLWEKKDERPPPAFAQYPNGQLIPKLESRYVYFAASSERGVVWQLDPSANYCLVSCILSFRYSDESEVRNVPTPSIVQKLK